MEAYVAEEVARDQLDADPALREEYRRKIDQRSGLRQQPGTAAGLLRPPPLLVG